MESSFVHLHNHSEFSILDGALKTSELVEEAFKNKMPAVALTDHGNIFGAVKFFKEAEEKKVKPILGCETYVAPVSRLDKTHDSKHPSHFHLVLLVKNEQGYLNLCQLLTKSYREGFYYKPRIDKELLAAHCDGLIGLSGCLQGEISYYLARGQDERAEKAARDYALFFTKGDFYIELQDHNLPEQKKVKPLLVEMAQKLQLPLVATNDIHYLHQEDAESHDILLCIQTNKKVTDQDRIRFGTQEFYFKSAEEMKKTFHDVPEALQNSARIAAKCNFKFPTSDYFLPHFEPPEQISVKDYFEKVVKDGFQERIKALKPRIDNGSLPGLDEYEKRLEKEIVLIEKMGFEGYFLIVWDLIREARARNIPVGPGRGSAAGSLLAFSLGITTIDPLEYDLLFERFLNPDRISLPDIDIDFCGRRREEVLSYVTNKYGQDNVSQIITFGTMAARQVVRDVGRALEVPLPEVDRIAKMIPPFGPDATIEESLKSIPQLKEIADKNTKISHLLASAQRLEGQVRHPSIHAAGIVITPKPLVEYMPLYRSVKGEITSQFPMQDIETIGLLKMDLLGLRNLTAIQDTVELVKSDLGQNIDMGNIPLDDEKTFQLFQAGNTDGVFQFESGGMKRLLRRYKPESFRDLIALNALYRPGPLKSGMTDEFVRLKNHPERIQYEIEELEPVLKETRGIIVYQEQVMKIATELSGFSMAEADLLRKAMGKKKKSVMKDQKQHFISGAKKKGLSQPKANKLFEQIKHFAGYGFNKSHSAAYAYLAFQTAYLKSHFAVYFMAALLTSEAERGATSQIDKYINSCRAMDIQILPPDINQSHLNFVVEDNKIRFGLSAVKNVGEGAIRAIIQERDNNGKFKSPFDIVKNIDAKVINRKVLESLIKSGAFDSLEWKRSQLFHLVDKMIDYAHENQKIRASKQNALFGDTHLPFPQIPAEVGEMREWDETLLLSYEKDALGLYITGHPLAQFGERLNHLVSHSLNQLDEEQDFDQEVRVAGIISGVKSRKNKDGEQMASFTLEDLGGRILVVVFSEAYKKHYDLIRDDLLVWLKGKFMGEGDNRRIYLSSIMLLSEAFLKKAKKVALKIFLPGIEDSVYEELKSILHEHRGDCPVYFELVTPHSYRMVVRSVEVQSVKPTEKLIKSIENLLGEESVDIEY
jgi:DNA polymerase-3 subunit alpha